MKPLVQSLRQTAEAVLSGHKGRRAQRLAWAMVSVHPTLRAARLAQQGHITKPLELLNRRPSLAAEGARIKARLADMAGFLQQPPSAPPAATARRPFNGRVLYALHSCGAFDPSGYASRSVALIKALAAQGINPIITTRPGYPWDLANHRHLPKRQEVAHGDLRFHLAPDAALNIHAPESAYMGVYGEHLARLAQEHDVTVIHAASNFINGAAAALAGRALGIMSIYEVRGLWHLTRAFTEPGYAATEHYRYCEKREVFACGQVDHVITLSQGLGQWLMERGIPEHKITVVGNAAHPPPSDPGSLRHSAAAIRQGHGIPPIAKVIGYLGALAEYEGLDSLLYAHSRTPAPKRPYLLLVGGGKHEAALRKLARKLGAESTVRFAGWVGADQVSAHYAAMDALILPRRDDVLTRLVPAIKPFEILAHGRPLFVSPPLAEALGDTLPGGYTVIDLAAVSRLDELVADAAPPMQVTVPTWHDRAEQVYGIYRRSGPEPTP